MSTSIRDRLVRLAYRFVWNHDDAEEIAQDALATACERSGELRRMTTLTPPRSSFRIFSVGQEEQRPAR